MALRVKVCRAWLLQGCLALDALQVECAGAAGRCLQLCCLVKVAFEYLTKHLQASWQNQAAAHRLGL